MTQILNTSIAASWLVAAVIVLRLVLRRAPKAFHCCLWALAAIRLLCPFSVESRLSLVPSREVIPESYLTQEPADWESTVVLEPVVNPAYEDVPEIPLDTTVEQLLLQDVYATLAWYTGMGLMTLYAVYSYLSLRLRSRFAAWVEGKVWECDEVDSPFILGILRPRIYLPAALEEQTRTHVVAHEKAHLRRGDQFWKPLGYGLLTVHWFNLIMWRGYWLLCRDIELACDEAVIQKLDRSGVCRYSETLVRCSIHRRTILACPLAFGEVGVKGRVKTMLHYKKPTFTAGMPPKVLEEIEDREEELKELCRQECLEEATRLSKGDSLRLSRDYSPKRVCELLALACQDTIDHIGEGCHIAVQETGQQWFELYAEHAKQTLAEVGEDKLWEDHLGCALTLEALMLLEPRSIYNHPYDYIDWCNSSEGQRGLYGNGA